MELLSHLKPGDVLREADLASYIGAMGLGVAEAQRSLDDNTLHMLAEFIKPLPTMADKSLLQLGLTPAFYHFRTATLSCSVGMNLRVTQSINVGGSIGMGGSQNSSQTKASATLTTTSASEKIVFTESQKIAVSSTGNAVEKIDSYTSQNATSTERFVVAERAAVSKANEFSASQLVKYNPAAALFVVPPAGMAWAVLRITSASADGEIFQIIDGTPPYSPPSATTPQALVQGVAAHVSSSNVIVGIFSANPTLDDLGVVKFKIGSHVIKTIGSDDFAANLRALAHIIIASGATSVDLTGHTDGVGSKAYNMKLSKLRAKAVREVLQTNGVPDSVELKLRWVGEAGVTDNLNDADARKVVIKLTPAMTGHFIFLQEVTAGVLSSDITGSPGSANGWAAAGSYEATGVVNGAVVTATSDVVTEVTNSGNAEASVIGELVYLTNKEASGASLAQISVYAAENKTLTTTSATNLDIHQNTAKTGSTTDTDSTTENRASAVAFSLDARYSRMFDLTMSGNMSISAELVSVPPPAEFLEFIKEQRRD